MRFATVDIGTNSVLLLVAERDSNGLFHPIAERMEITRLGRGVDRTGALSEEALADTLSALRAFADEARALGATSIAATATSAARDATNGQELIRRAAALGVPVEIIGGEREAQLSYAAVAFDFAPGDERIAVIDIGGGSTEFIVGQGPQVSFRRSINVGSVRLTERYVEGDPPTAESIARVDAALGEALTIVPRVDAGVRVVGIAGTFTTMAAIARGVEPYDPERIHGLELSVAELDRVGEQLARLPLSQRQHLPGLSPKRADVIVAGARLAARSVRALGVDRVTIGDRGVRWGYLYDQFGVKLK
jgi:exopolyphosphatase/guanosine-5'-triphosphate,3'-diphosphate pyrophosphatase